MISVYNSGNSPGLFDLPEDQVQQLQAALDAPRDDVADEPTPKATSTAKTKGYLRRNAGT